jgi:hypothetical protein
METRRQGNGEYEISHSEWRYLLENFGLVWMLRGIHAGSEFQLHSFNAWHMSHSNEIHFNEIHFNEIHFLAIKEVFSAWHMASGATFDLTHGIGRGMLTWYVVVASNMWRSNEKHLLFIRNSFRLNEILVQTKNATACACGSKLGITFATSIRIAHMTQIWKSFFGAHVMATQLRSMRVFRPKIQSFSPLNPYFKLFSVIFWKYSFSSGDNRFSNSILC